jgi:RNA-directed DNA polymerase
MIITLPITVLGLFIQAQRPGSPDSVGRYQNSGQVERLVMLDEWLRLRIRMCYWKQWRYTRTKVRNLLKLGTPKKQAIRTALSRKGPWHLARTLATQSGMTNKWLYEQGLISVKEQWVKIHYPATAR